MYAPADGLPCLKPTFGNTPCSPSGVEDATHVDGEPRESRSDVYGATLNEELTKKQSGSLDDETTANEEGGGESSITPKPSPRGLLEEALGLERTDQDKEEQNLPHSDFTGDIDDEDSTKGDSIDESGRLDEVIQAVRTTKINDNGAEFSDPLERAYWPHEPRYCADVWQRDGDQEYGTVTRCVWTFTTYSCLF